MSSVKDILKEKFMATFVPFTDQMHHFQKVPFLAHFFADTILDMIEQHVGPDVCDVIIIDEPEPPKILYKIYYRRYLMFAIGTTVNGEFQIISNRYNKNTLQKTFSSFHDILSEFYLAVNHLTALNKIEVRDKKIEISGNQIITEMITRCNCSNFGPSFDPNFDPIRDAYEHGASETHEQLMHSLFNAAGPNEYIRSFLAQFFGL
jgi:hypothetical protein